MTADVDLTVITGFGNEAPFVDALLAKLPGRISDAKTFALRHRTLLLVASNAVHADVSLGAMPFEERAVERASPFEIATTAAVTTVTTCSAEDLIVHKAFAGRPKDWLDIEGIIERQREFLNREQIWSELLPLLELRDDPSIEPRLRAVLQRRR